MYFGGYQCLVLGETLYPILLLMHMSLIQIDINTTIIDIFLQQFIIDISDQLFLRNLSIIAFIV